MRSAAGSLRVSRAQEAYVMGEYSGKPPRQNPTTDLKGWLRDQSISEALNPGRFLKLLMSGLYHPSGG